MAKIALRVYNNEIKDLTDHGQIEEAIAHCRHILETFPKHVDTYRLLGKAYLEEQRYGDAADILQRVLSSIPEDFISQVGMSIIREDEGNLETAIFHMERAFEVQPSNHAIQDELKRLYGRRDGIEPQKIRLTRGALARMYAHGNLHDLAIAELLAALSEDPQRYDLVVLLANMYYQADKKIEAAETCTKILEKLPYCLDANRLLATILETNDREENAKIYRDRWIELDPYAGALDKGEINTEFVPNQTVTVERLDWEPGTFEDDTYGRPAWATSLGVDIADDTGEGGALPDWMRKKEEEVEPTESLFGEPTEERELPPLWETTPDQEPEDLENLEFKPESPKIDDSLFASEKPPEDSLFPSGEEKEEMPEWLRTPSEESPDQLSISGEGEETPEWMQIPTDSVESQKEESLFPSEGEEESTPEWMSLPEDESLEQPGASPDASEAIPDFMKEAGWEPSSSEDEPPVPAFSETMSEEQEEETTEGESPMWMQDLATSEEEPEPSPFTQEEVPLSGDIQEEAFPGAHADIEGEEETETPAWLSQIEDQETIGGTDEIETPLASTDQPTEREPQPEGEEEPSMDWLDQLSREAAEEAAPEPHTEPQPEVEEPSPTVEPSEAPISSMEEEEGLGWLESLAAKQGVAEEELVTSPEERSETPPDWLQETTAKEEEPQPEGEEEPSLEWLDQLSLEPDEEAPTFTTPDEEPLEEGEDWLDRLDQPEEIPSIPGSEPLEVESEEDEGTARLENLVTEQGTEERVEPQIEPEDELSMEWLGQLSQEAAEEAAPSTEPADEADKEVEAWLGGLKQPTEDSGIPISESEDEEADEGLAWLEDLAESGAGDEIISEPSVQEGVQEELIPDMSDEEPPEWVLPEKEETAEETSEEEPSLEWLSEVSQEGPTEGEGEKEVKISTDWLNQMSDIEDDLEIEEELGSTPEAIDKVDEWIQSLDQPEVGEEIHLEPEVEFPPIESDSETVATSATEEEASVEPDAETVVSHVEEDELVVEGEAESETPMVPEWLQDVAEQKPEPDALEKPPEWLPEVEEPGMESEEVAPTQPSEWQPESEVKDQFVEEESKPTPTPKLPPEESPDMLEEARQSMHEHKLDEAVDAYAKLIKRGKAIEETIEDIEEALRKHPINPALWQVLGDALMRSDRLQEALDAYSKAEDLLR